MLTIFNKILKNKNHKNLQFVKYLPKGGHATVVDVFLWCHFLYILEWDKHFMPYTSNIGFDF